MDRRRTAPIPIGPLRLAVEHYVHCPRGGLVRVARCEACELMQGMLVGDRVEVLCAYPEPVPALHSGGQKGRVRPRLVRRSRAGARTTSLIFESDWPED